MNNIENFSKKDTIKSVLVVGLIFGFLGVSSLSLVSILDMSIPCSVTVGYCHPILGMYTDFFKGFLLLGLTSIGVIGAFIVIWGLAFGSWFIFGGIIGLVGRKFVKKHIRMFYVFLIISIILIPIVGHFVSVIQKSHMQSQLNREGMVRIGDGGRFIYKNGQWQPY